MPFVDADPGQPQSGMSGTKSDTVLETSSVSDQPVDKGQLGFEPYVHALSAFPRSDGTQPPLAVSVEGEWGSGKSSFMLQLEK